MENFSNYSSYPDSRDSSPRSRDVIDDAASWEEPQQQQQQQQHSYKAKFMISYGGKIQPRPHDNQLAYIGGDTKILSVDRSVRLPAFLAKLSAVWPPAGDELCFKYQLPGEDLDALISVTNDEDLDHMMIEYDRLHRSSPKPARLRLFLFSQSQTHHAQPSSDRQWFVDALNSVQIQPQPQPDTSSPPPLPLPLPSPPPPTNPDFLFGFDKQPPPPPPDPTPAAGSESGSEEQPSAAEIQRQIQELHRLQIAAQEQAIMQRKFEEFGNPRIYTAAPGVGGDFYSQSLKPPEKLPPPAQIPLQLQMQIPQSYASERHVPGGTYHMAAQQQPPPPQPSQQQTGMEQPVYLIQTPGGVYHQAAGAQMRPMAQPYYGVHPREAFYRDQGPNQGIPMMPQPKAEQTGFTQVGYDNTGRQVYYTTAAATTAYQNVGPVSGGSGGSSAGGLSQDGKVIVGKASQSSAPM